MTREQRDGDIGIHRNRPRGGGNLSPTRRLRDMANTRNQGGQATLLDYYEKIGRVSQLMVRAAENGDWSTLADAEALCEQLIRRMRSIGEPLATLDAAGRRRRLEILRAILADDARIREITQPWMSRVAPYVGAQTRRRKRA